MPHNEHNGLWSLQENAPNFVISSEQPQAENLSVQHNYQLSITIYASKTWKINAKIAHRLNVFQQHCLRKILKVTYHDCIKNEEFFWRYNVLQGIITKHHQRLFGCFDSHTKCLPSALDCGCECGLWFLRSAVPHWSESPFHEKNGFLLGIGKLCANLSMANIFATFYNPVISLQALQVLSMGAKCCKVPETMWLLLDFSVYLKKIVLGVSSAITNIS